MTQQEATQRQSQRQPQQPGIEEEFPHPDRGHGSEVDLDDLPPPTSDFFPGHHNGVVEG
jgi:hypothetical protein